MVTARLTPCFNVSYIWQVNFWEILLSFVQPRNEINLQHLIIQFPLYDLSSGLLREVKNRRKFQTFSSKSGHKRLACSRLSLAGVKRKKEGEWEKKWERTKVRKGRETACKNIFNDPLPPTFGLMRCRKIKMSTSQLAGNVLLFFVQGNSTIPKGEPYLTAEEGR